tara:strand:+ start:343 stop:471 length:129 start_codon:yes stop_codon:yes gene_type:complete
MKTKSNNKDSFYRFADNKKEERIFHKNYKVEDEFFNIFIIIE